MEPRLTHSPDDENVTELSSLIDRYYAGHASPADITAAEAAFQRNPALREAFDAMREVLAAQSRTDLTSVTSVEIDAMCDAIVTDHVPASSAAIPVSSSQRDRSRARGWMIRRFALPSIGIAAGVFVGLMVWRNTLSSSAAHHEAGHTYRAQIGQRTDVRLPDGSRAVLAPQTVLTVASDFGKTSRAVSVSGEAHFDVVAQTRAPFVVRANDVATRVLGTTFDVRYYKNDPDVRVIVSTGKVVMTSKHAALTLTAGMVGRVTDSTAVTSAVRDMTTYTDWATGRLEFRRAPLRDVVAELNRAYGAAIRVSDSTLSATTVTWTCDVSTQSLGVMLEELMGLMDAHQRRTGDVIHILPGRSRTRRLPPFTPTTAEVQYGR